MTYSQLVGERLGDDEQYNYRLRGLPEGKSFRDPDNYDTLYASWLKIDGIGFAADQFELGEYGETVRVKQHIEGGSAEIIFGDIDSD
jgi:hypothetical protein